MKIKKLLSAILVLVMITVSMSASVFAEETEPDMTETQQEEPETTDADAPDEEDPGEEMTEEDSADVCNDQNDDPRVRYIKRTYDAASGQVTEREYDSPTYIKMSSFNDDESVKLSYGFWYVVDKDVTFNNRITVEGTARLILVNGNTLTCRKGIAVRRGATFNIYGQAGDEGKLVTKTEYSDDSPLGGNSGEKAGCIIIYGGNIISSVNCGYAAAIGGGKGVHEDPSAGSAEEITIYGGTIEAKVNNSGAGIGGGKYGYASWDKGITIYGGDITARGHSGAGIGNGPERSGSPGDIRIYGGKIDSEGFGCCAGIGGGDYGSNGKISIYGGRIESVARGSQYTGAGIGAGGKADQAGDIYISGGDITATSRQGAGIGAGAEGDGGKITIDGGVITATSAEGGAGIGGGKQGDGAYVIINDGKVSAVSKYFDDSHSTTDRWVLYGEKVKTNEVGEGIIIIFTLLYDWVRDTDLSGAGIGGGFKGSGNTVEINGGTVSAAAGCDGACAIGWGNKGSSSGTCYFHQYSKVADRYEDKKPVFVKASERMKAIRSRQAYITRCDHAENDYQCISQANHYVSCRYCSMDAGMEAHEFGSDSKCIRCGSTGQTVNVRFVEKNTAGEQITYDRSVYLGSVMSVEGPQNTPEGRDFAGWLDSASGEVFFEGDKMHIVNEGGHVLTAVYDTATVASYVDPDGRERSVRARIVNGDTVCFAEGWYVVSGNVTIDAEEIRCHGRVNLILADGAFLDIRCGRGIVSTGDNDMLAVYRQSGGTGRLKINKADLFRYVQYGGNVEARNVVFGGDVSIYGGTFDSNWSVFNDSVLFCGGSINLGRIDYNSDIRLDWVTPEISVCYKALYPAGDDNLIVIEEGKRFTDGANEYSGTMTIGQMYMAEGQTLVPSNASLYGEPEWVWASDYSTAKAVFTPLSGGGKMEIEATVTAESNTTRTYYSAVVEYNEQIYTDIKQVAKKWNLYVGGVQVTGDNASDILGDGKVSYDAANNTLNLEDGAVIDGTDHTDGSCCGIRYCINRTYPFTVNVKGSTDISCCPVMADTTYGIAVLNVVPDVDANFIIKGSGLLHIVANDADKVYGIHCSGSVLRVDKVTLRLDIRGGADDRAIDCNYLIASGSAHITSVENGGSGYALYASSLQITDDSELVLDAEGKAVNEECEIRPATVELGADVGDSGNHLSSWDGTTNLSNYKYVSFPNTVRPAGYSLTLDGMIGLNVYVDMSGLSDEEKEGSYMTFEIEGKGTCTARDDQDQDFYVTDPVTGGKYYGFTCRIDSVQMADKITAVWHFGDGKTRSYVYSVKEYLEFFDGHEGEYDEKTIALVHALSDYGHYVQPYLADENGWILGTDYAEMTAFYRGSYDYDEVSAALSTQVVEADFADTAVTMVTYRLRLDSSIALEVIMNVSGGNAVTCDDYPVSKAGSGRYKITIDGINAADLDKPLVITGNAGGSYSLTLSPLCYVKAVMSGSGHSSVSRNAMASLYYYYKAAEEYN